MPCILRTGRATREIPCFMAAVCVIGTLYAGACGTVVVSAIYAALPKPENVNATIPDRAQHSWRRQAQPR